MYGLELQYYRSRRYASYLYVVSSVVVHFDYVKFDSVYLLQTVAYVCHKLSDLVKAIQRSTACGGGQLSTSTPHCSRPYTRRTGRLVLLV